MAMAEASPPPPPARSARRRRRRVLACARVLLLGLLALASFRGGGDDECGDLLERRSPPGGAGGALADAPRREPSPACRPHFQLALPPGGGNRTSMDGATAKKFERLYFYHVRKGGGTNLRHYFRKVAAHRGLRFEAVEYDLAEIPGSDERATFYVTHLREPVARSISHFKYEGRWNCRQLVDNATFVPTPENARELESWNQNFGHVPTACTKFVDGAPAFVSMAQCATNCHVQWFGGLSCPWWDPPLRPGPDARPIRREVPMNAQYRAARDKLFEYNFIVIMEKLNDPSYVAAVEEFFGVPGIARRGRHAWCELESHYANEKMPLAIPNETKRELIRRNAADVALYRELGGCLDGRGGYDFPTWDASRFATDETLRMNHARFDETFPEGPQLPPSAWRKRFERARNGTLRG